MDLQDVDLWEALREQVPDDLHPSTQHRIHELFTEMEVADAAGDFREVSPFLKRRRQMGRGRQKPSSRTNASRPKPLNLDRFACRASSALSRL